MIQQLQTHYNTTIEETEFVEKLCKRYLYHPRHVYCRRPTEVVLCLYYLVILQHRQHSSTRLAYYCRSLDGEVSYCLRIYTAMRSILAPHLVKCPQWCDPIPCLDYTMTFIYPHLIASSPDTSEATCLFSLQPPRTTAGKKRKRDQPLVWPPMTEDDETTFRTQTALLITLAKQHGLMDGRHCRPIVLSCLIIVLLSHYHSHAIATSAACSVSIHWNDIALQCQSDDVHERSLKDRYSEMMQVLTTLGQSLPWLQHLKKADTLYYMKDIMAIILPTTTTAAFQPPAYRQSIKQQSRRRAQLASIENDNSDDDPSTPWMAALIASGEWHKETLVSMTDGELASRAHRLARPLDKSHDLDRQPLDDNDLSKEEQAVYLHQPSL